MSGNILIIFGAVFPLDITENNSRLTSELYDLMDSTGLIEKPYSGNSDAPFFCGEIVSSMRQYSYPATGYEKVRTVATIKERKNARLKYDSLPEHLRFLTTKIGHYVIPCP